MQFYIINKNPETNARLLPDYAIKSVNVREGFTIICDIAHRFEVEFEGQAKPYNPFHPLTREYSHKGSFIDFIEHFHQCCNEYEKRFGKRRQEINCYNSTGALKFLELFYALPANREQETIHYLMTRKGDKLNNIEFDRLMATQGLNNE